MLPSNFPITLRESFKWRLQRLARAETAVFHSRVQGLKADLLGIEARSYEKTITDHLHFPLDITDKAAHAEAREAARRPGYERNRDEVLLGRALDADAKDGGHVRQAHSLREESRAVALSDPRRASPTTG